MLTVMVFLAGAAGMTLEIVGFRLLQPVFGSGIYVWGSLIGVFLLALTVGYALGGRIADRAPQSRVLGGIVLLAGLAITLVPLYAGPLGDGLLARFDQAGASPETVARFGSFLGGLALFGPAGILLGMVTPYAIRLGTGDLTHVGRTAGGLTAAATAGSLLGTLGTAWYGIAAVPASTLLYGMGGVLIVMGLVLFSSGRGAATTALLLLAALSLSGHASAQAPRTLLQKDSLYHRISVRDAGPYRELIFGGTRVQSQTRISLSDPLHSGWRYTDAFHLGPLLVPNAQRALFVGLGGGIGPRQFRAMYPRMRIDVVELDPEVVKVAKDYFFLKEDERLRVHVDDGRAFVRRAKRGSYDLIFLDAYFADAIPFHLTTREFFQIVRQKLAPGGAVFTNFAGPMRGRGSAFFRSMYKTMQAVFSPESCLFFPVSQQDGHNTVSYALNGRALPTRDELAARAQKIKSRRIPFVARIAGDSQRNVAGDARILTDDFAPVENLVPLR